MPAPTAAPTRAGASNGHPTSAAMARPEPAPMPPPVAARSPHVSPHPETLSARGSTSRQTLLAFMSQTSKRGVEGPQGNDLWIGGNANSDRLLYFNEKVK